MHPLAKRALKSVDMNDFILVHDKLSILWSFHVILCTEKVLMSVFFSCLFAIQQHELEKEIDKNKPHVFHGYFLWRAGTYAIFY